MVTIADLTVGERWVYFDSKRGAVEVIVHTLGRRLPERVKVEFVTDEFEGQTEWIPPTRLKVPWDQADTFEPASIPRREYGSGSVYRDGQGRWNAVVSIRSSDGKRRRRAARSKSEAVVRAKLGGLLVESKLAAEAYDLARRSVGHPTVAEWLDEWFRTIATRKIRPKTAATYRTVITKQIVPHIGDIPLVALKPSDVRGLDAAIISDGRSSTTSAQAYRILSVALKYAVREEIIPRNVAELVDSPRRAINRNSALTVEQCRRVIAAATGDPLESLWVAVLLTGARQGELLGLEHSRVSDFLEVSWQLQRLPWQHGCGDTCGRIRGTDCSSRRVVAPADWECRYLQGGFWLTRPKSVAGARLIPLIEPLKALMNDHISADEGPNPHGLVWHEKNGAPIDPGVQSRKWHALLVAAGVPDMRLHDGRHSAVDLMYESGMPEDIIRQIVGHSTTEMTRAYRSQRAGARLSNAMGSLEAMMRNTE
ncbi:hypothetical protein B7R54_15105 [Subtercola boreus]|uniref:Integrase n=1 Tax=Subtercola boreus TaxID=120213 RepID=A0A3E0VK87_9MICO|nr:site-specific integrase [Subtercola boreus]RFA10384.1 hypothetical protein B7R54_15105 [Subtercola boreus]TQL56100.1 integrase-like protein [Subtercola boreus]